MTVPSERTKSIRWGFEFLGELLLDSTVDDSIRAMAERVLVAYPPPDLIRHLIDVDATSIPRPAAEALVKAAELWTVLRRSRQGTEETKRSLMYVERHFPERSIAESLGRSPVHGVRTWLLPEDHLNSFGGR